MADDAFREACQGYKVAANICLFRTSALRSVGLYRPGTNFVEDWDLWVRLAAHGWGNLYVEAILANYRVWSDASGFRRGRKVTELVGLRHIFEDSLEPAFRERNWSLGPLTVARRRLANGQARALRWVPKESEDYVIMTRELINLGDSRGLRFRIDLVNLGFGWMLDAFARSQVLLRDLAKALLIRLRRIRQNRAKVADDGS
jgi:GT2 family glycosyltransferase